jgi:hypothetical protein
MVCLILFLKVWRRRRLDLDPLGQREAKVAGAPGLAGRLAPAHAPLAAAGMPSACRCGFPIGSRRTPAGGSDRRARREAKTFKQHLTRRHPRLDAADRAGVFAFIWAAAGERAQRHLRAG